MIKKKNVCFFQASCVEAMRVTNVKCVANRSTDPRSLIVIHGCTREISRSFVRYVIKHSRRKAVWTDIGEKHTPTRNDLDMEDIKCLSLPTVNDTYIWDK